MEGYKNSTIPVAERVSDLLSRMTLEEKAAQLASCLYSDLVDGSNGCTSIRDMQLSEEAMKKIFKNGMGQVAIITASNKDPVDAAKVVNQIQRAAMENSRLGIPVIFDAEAAVGLIARESTHNPMPIGQAAAWEPELVERTMKLAREQMKAVGVREVFAPVIDVTRDPRWGRLEETYGEDPYLTSTMGTAYIRGIQGDSLREGVACTAKHFLAYGLSEGGMNMASCKLSEREIYEQAAVPFEAAVKEAHIAGIMSSYNDIDGEPVTGSVKYCRHLLRDKWGFDGLLVQDAGAMPRLVGVQRVAEDFKEAGIMSSIAGIDLELMSNVCFGENLVEAVREGKLAEKYVNESCARHLKLKFELGLFEQPYLVPAEAETFFHTKERSETARKLVQSSVVMLKNEKGILPIRKTVENIAVIGPQGDNLRGLFTNYSHIAIQDVFRVVAVDSLFANATDEYPIHGVTLLEGMQNKIAPEKIHYVKGCSIENDRENEYEKAVEAARNAEVVVLAVGSVSGFLTTHNCGEARDSATLRLPGGQEGLVKAVVGTGKPVVLVVVGGRVFGMEDIYESVDAALVAWAPGEEGGNGIADVLFGDFNPSGKLPLSIPRQAGQIPVYYNHKCGSGKSMPHGSYTDMPCTPLYAFGYGMSYTTYQYSDLVLSSHRVMAEDMVTATLTIGNTGKIAGDEIVQLYIRDEVAQISRPDMELKGYQKVHLKPQEKKQIAFTFSLKQMAFYDRNMDYVLEPGTFRIMIGSSSDYIRLEDTVELGGETMIIGEADKIFFTKSEIHEIEEG